MKDTKVLLENVRMRREWCVEDLARHDEDIARMEKEEAEKPELRHGDYGLSERGGDEDGNFIVVAQSTLPGSPKAFYGDGAGQINVNDCTRSHVRLGNIFADLSALSSDMTEFETRYGGETIYWGFSPQCKDLTFTTPTSTHIIRNSDVSTFIRNLQIMYATMKKKGLTNAV